MENSFKVEAVLMLLWLAATIAVMLLGAVLHRAASYS